MFGSFVKCWMVKIFWGEGGWWWGERVKVHVLVSLKVTTMVTYSMSEFFNFGLESPDFKFHLYCFVWAHNGIYKVLWGKSEKKIFMKIVICNIKITRLCEYFWSKTIPVGSTYVIQYYSKRVKCLNKTYFKPASSSYNRQ